MLYARLLILMLLVAMGATVQAKDWSVGSYEELANAIRNASDGDTIRLTADITMSDHPPEVTKQITVDGDGHTISGDEQFRIFFVAESGDLSINDLTLTKGRAQDGDPECLSGRDWSDEVGGAICNNGRLTIRDSSFNDSSANSGGAIYYRGRGKHKRQRLQRQFR